ncbi:MAG: hypothetical protein V1755_06490 [Chloroflexota bacterium]
MSVKPGRKVAIPVDLWAELAPAAEAAGRSVSEFIRLAAQSAARGQEPSVKARRPQRGRPPADPVMGGCLGCDPPQPVVAGEHCPVCGCGPNV